MYTARLFPGGPRKTVKQYLALVQQSDAEYALRVEQYRHLPHNEQSTPPVKPDQIKIFCPDDKCNQPLIFVGKLQAMSFVNVHDDLPHGPHFAHYGKNTPFAANPDCGVYYPQDPRFEGHEKNRHATEIRQMIRETLDEPDNHKVFVRMLNMYFGHPTNPDFVEDVIKKAKAEVTGSAYREVLIDHPELFPPLAALVAGNHMQKLGKSVHEVVFRPDTRHTQTVTFDSIRGDERTDSVPKFIQLHFSHGLHHSGLGRPVFNGRYPVVVNTKKEANPSPAPKPAPSSNGSGGPSSNDNQAVPTGSISTASASLTNGTPNLVLDFNQPVSIAPISEPTPPQRPFVLSGEPGIHSRKKAALQRTERSPRSGKTAEPPAKQLRLGPI